MNEHPKPVTNRAQKIHTPLPIPDPHPLALYTDMCYTANKALNLLDTTP